MNGHSREDLRTLKYTVEKIPSKPVDGTNHVYPLYIAMHGGGEDKDGTANDRAWQHMMASYKGRITDGIWVAVRGIGNTWDMHFTGPGHVLVERLIEYMILFHNVDPNRVYLVGFSAGGDSGFRIGNRLAQRFAACEIGGGDPGDVRAGNFMNLPVCLQVGEQDEGWVQSKPLGRSKHVAQFGIKLDVLAKIHPDYYTHSVFIHPTGRYEDERYDPGNRKHNSWEKGNFDNDQTAGKPTTIIQDYVVWLEQYEKNRQNAVDNWASLGITPAEVENTNTIDWPNNKKSRNPTPTKVFWDLGVGNFNDQQPKEEKDRYWQSSDNFRFVRPSDFHGLTQNYWLAIVPPPPATSASPAYYHVHKPGTSIMGQLDRANNKVMIAVTGETEDDINFGVRVLLRPGVLRDLSQSIAVEIKTTIARPEKKVTSAVLDVGPRLVESERVIKDTLVRNDPSLVFTSDIILVKEVVGGTTTWSALKYTS
ncbi:hypothetical protein QBC37DRAFT_20022 [Rhypophila decipiens]|uniref:Uncharacterized protein n=1 Tax=Rhypophila decipiens TaxID=261697 RepID=A0AAN7B4Y2_9PEZI|nr:hypothetical protein QBC37DRAFT_20022 [Rhypophila decipiens]